MKITISVGDAVAEQIDAVARDVGLSRGEVIAAALREYLARQRRRDVLEQLNKAYVKEASAKERTLVRTLKSKVSISAKW